MHDEIIFVLRGQHRLCLPHPYCSFLPRRICSFNLLKYIVRLILFLVNTHVAIYLVEFNSFYVNHSINILNVGRGVLIL